ncbi:DUF3137 domain-containing protein [Geofilum rubicundum]|uniref:Galanin n=1 Tax=Geofilum rubicundum JCM 15548 TaxID=1236989 RepID=A0A0E9LXR7_9BACT|nr:DUF3137 domain-containing protein [Geofilum rubicundum]GAO30098.1 hypothetical protein JCM15548_12350 [Geofilum rubicundum JCM 15548]
MKTPPKSFDEIFEKISPNLQLLEEVRKNRAKDILLWEILGITSLALIFLVFNLGLYFLGAIIILFILYCVGMVFEKLDVATKDLAPKFKKTVILALLDYFYDHVEYIPNQRMSIHLLNKSLLIRKFVYKHWGEDFITCRIGHTDVYFSEIETFHLNQQKSTFRGVFIAVMFNKQFSTKTVVINRKDSTLFRKAKLNLFGDMKKANYVKLESIEFNKNFLVIAEDQIEARFKLTPALMEMMLAYKKKLNTTVSFSFIENYLYITIQSDKNLFEPRLLKPLNDKKFIENNYLYLDLLTTVVKDLDLNTRIWL